MSDAQLLTHSGMRCFRDCPRKYEMRYEMGLRKESDSLALRFGSGFHAVIDAVAKGIDPEEAVAPYGR